LARNAALSPGRPLGTFEDGWAACSWTAAAGFAETPSGIRCLIDGHVYNRRELALELGLSPEFETAELLAYGYADQGVGLLQRLRGDFALFLWNPASRMGLLAVDQLGGRGLFIRRSADGIAFASEIRNLRRLLSRRPEPDTVAVSHWLAHAELPEGRTLYHGVEPVAPATCVMFDEGRIAVCRYWTPRYGPRSDCSPADAGTEVLACIGQAIERRADPENVNGVLLTGGIESASVAGVAALLGERERPRRSYSATFPRHPQIDEHGLVSAIADHAELEATLLAFESGGPLLGALSFLQRWKLPPATPNLAFLHPLLRQTANDGIQVLFDGAGGDAIFWHSTELLAERVRHGRLTDAWRLAGSLPEYGIPTTLRTRATSLRRWGRKHKSSPAMPGWLGRRSKAIMPPPASSLYNGPTWWAAKVESILGPGSQKKHSTSRRLSALSGIETRHPLLDVDLIELVLSFPPEMAFDRRYCRPVLRDAVTGLVPDVARLRPHRSNFDPILVEGVRADLPVIQRLLLATDAHSRAYTDSEALARHLNSPPAGLGPLREWAMALWRLASLECWLRLCAGEDPLPLELKRRVERPVFAFTGR
jgi:asparagine synthase (glutamine-hydrolysing)